MVGFPLFLSFFVFYRKILVKLQLWSLYIITCSISSL